MAITNEQDQAVYGLFGVGLAHIITSPHYALIETTGTNPKRLEVPIKPVPLVKTKTRDHFLISAGLARELNTDETRELRILSIYQKAEEINLDQI